MTRQHSRRPFMEPAPITKRQVLDAAAHWRTLADNEDAAADWEIAHGLPRGNISSYLARAKLWRTVADDLQAQGEAMEE